MDIVRALQTWYDYGKLLRSANRRCQLSDDDLECAIVAHRQVWTMITDDASREREKQPTPWWAGLT